MFTIHRPHAEDPSQKAIVVMVVILRTANPKTLAGSRQILCIVLALHSKSVKHVMLYIVNNAYIISVYK